MNNFQGMLFWMEKAGIIAFSISGAMIGVEEAVDLFGVLFLGLITALGGGTLRDTLLGTVPSANFFDYQGIVLSLFTSLIVFSVAYTKRKYYYSHMDQIERLNNVVDSVGLGFFAVCGVQAALEAGYSTNIFLLAFMGMLTGVGGGLLRDVIVKRVPVIFSKHIYAVAAISGGVCYIALIRSKMNETAAVIFSVLLVVFIRMLSTQKKLNLPKVRRI
ncbi:trimeric intracellular cation channel family protein [Clostridium sp. chh4-2]|uniref:trimeric intracellular cation channel family protein n=1 Tax=Clostridium sp. chh4-2 TaxID=2067550 RepID=UPI0015E19D90|nr:trimeric intracellular cation channel family protein [Clostridium sp. chh4-2]